MVGLEIAAGSQGTRPKNKPEVITESMCYSDETSFGSLSSQIMPSNRGHLGLATFGFINRSPSGWTCCSTRSEGMHCRFRNDC